MARTASRRRPSAAAKRAQPSIRRLLIADALRSWVAPTVAVVVLAVAMLLDTLELVPDAPAAAIAVVGALVLAGYLAVSPLVAEEHSERLPPLVVVGVAAVLTVLLAVPFFARLFPGTPLRTVNLDARARGAVLVAPGDASRVNVVVDAQLPLAAERRDRTVHYDLDLVDDAGTHQHVDGDLGDSWRERRLGRRGTAPSHLEHLSATHVVDVGSGALRLADATLVGEAHATASATVYRHRLPPTVVLYAFAVLLVGAALAFDLWWDAAEASSLTMVTASACAAALVFLEGGAGHPGMRDVIGAAIVGTIAGTVVGGSATWIGRLVSPFGRTRRRA